MLKEFSWRTFEATGNIEAYIVYKQVREKDEGFKAIDFMDKLFAHQEIAISK